MKRIEKKFQNLKLKNRSAFVCYVCAGDPDYSTSLEILKNLPKAGVDLIELGVPFLDPAGDGPIIQNAARRAIANGASFKKTLSMVEEFRKIDNETPIILMGYYNPFLKYGLDKVFVDAEKSGVDGSLIVDLPCEEQDEIATEIAKTNLDFINLIAPLSDLERIKKISHSKINGGFLYLISMLGITGTNASSSIASAKILEEIKSSSDLPIVIGFGIQTPEQAAEFSRTKADGVVIGSTIVKEIDKNYSENKNENEIVEAVLKKVREFSNSIKSAK